VALNIRGLGGKAELIGLTGSDAGGDEVRQLLSEGGIGSAGMLADSTRPTTTKTRITSRGHQIVRLDEESTEHPAPELARDLSSQALRAISAGADAVILSDYNKGVISDQLATTVIRACNGRRIPVLVDPKRADMAPYANATCITPNLNEFHGSAAVAGLCLEPISASAAALRSRLGCATLLITQGADGMTLFDAQGSEHFPALAEEIFDVSGAGDTVIATLATALAAGLPIKSAAEFANVAASVVVRKNGTCPVEWSDFILEQVQGSPTPTGLPTARLKVLKASL
jgi:rfaE bifunctional protein kinase chain/domain